MLSRENNELLCRVGPGTPGNELFRSLWLPAVLSSQIGEAGSPPVRLKLLGEELLAFRDGTGAVGIVQAQCAHRNAPLFFGKVEERGIRCAYHGWLYDTQGKCQEIPSDATHTLCQKMSIRAYTVKEKADIAWIYMGDGVPPELPKFPWIDLPRSQRLATVWLQETNWVQGAEGEIDSSHVSILHKTIRSANTTRTHRPYTYADPTPQLTTHDTPIGFMSVARRKAEEQFYWRATQWMAPMFSFIPSAAWPVSGRAWVPADDDNTYCWDFSYSPDGPLPDEFMDAVQKGVGFPPEYSLQAVRLNTGSFIDTWVPKRNRSNDYLVDRQLQREFEATGIFGVNDQDRALQEGMGRMVDRSKEMLVAADVAIVTARRKLLDMLRSPARLAEFRELIADGSAYAVHPVDAVAPMSDVKVFLSELATV
ncbi:MAG: putative 3-chlorobenzoate-3,4-dioxygenase oxygenase [Rhizobacter sp.]|nr:putative 3-chlorobenzoate-3,4-dioxygenase oxygenase [Rhizobacter sp.]